MSSESAQGRQALAAALAPGFRFHPTDEELVGYYLKRKIAGKAFRVDAISDVDIYKSEPWDLPGKSRIQSRDLEWYFFSALDKKYANRSRTNRATGSGYWKTTGKDRAVLCGGRLVGMKKTLVFHIGRAPKGERTNWVMHEYRLDDQELSNSRIPQDAFVVCRVFQKKGPGPQNGAQYGAPLVEEEWDREEEEGVEEQGDGEISFNAISDDSLLEEEWSIEDLIVPPNSNIPDVMDNDIKDEYVELNDFLSAPTNLVTHEDGALETLPGLNSNEEEVNDCLEFLINQSPETNSYLEVSDILGPEPVGQNVPSPLEINSGENPGFLDAPNSHVSNSFASSTSEQDLLDELLAYFDATDNLDSESKGVDSNAQQVNLRQESLKSLGSTQPLIPPLDDNYDGIKSKGGLSGRLVSMLGSISSPPAFAAERRPDPLRVTPPMIQRDIDFFLAYPEDDLGKMPKIEDGFMAFVQRNSFHLVFLSVLLLAASFKICLCVCSR